MMKNEELFNRYLARDLTTEDQSLLKELLQTEEGRRDFYQFVNDSAEIGHYLKQDEKCQQEEAVFSKLVQQSEENLLRTMGGAAVGASRKTQESFARTKRILYIPVISLVAMLVVIGLWSQIAPPSHDLVSLDKSVARIVELNGQAEYTEGDWLRPGWVHLKSGTMEIVFDSGARVLLQGETEFKVETAQRGFLTSGKISALVPKEAVGFLVNTPHGSIVDLGTEFALTVAPEKSTEVYVFEGEVEVANLSGNELHILKSGAHLKIDSLGHVSSPISFVAENFQRLNKENKPLRTAYVHWPFEGESHSQLKDRGNGGFGQFYDLRLTESSPVKKQGKYGSAFYFNGKGQHLSSSFKGIGGGAARTISFWLRIPPDLKSGENYAIIAWGRLARSEKWQLGLNLQPRDGILGSIRTEFSEGYVIGTTDLRDGRWHHVSSVFIGGNSPDVATHIRHYIDGRLEGVSGFRSVKINTAVSGSGLEPVNLGRYINSKNWSLRGNIDEMYIFNSALSPAQIVLLRDKQLETE